VEAVVSFAKAAGFAVSAEELMKAQAAVSDEHLSNVSGGFFRTFLLRSFWRQLLDEFFGAPHSSQVPVSPGTFLLSSIARRNR
jgi:hypothetical protein